MNALVQNSMRLTRLLRPTSHQVARHVQKRYVQTQQAVRRSPESWQSGRQRSPTAHRQSGRWRPPTGSAQVHAGEAGPEAGREGPAFWTRTATESRARLFITYHDLERALERRGVKNVRTVLLAGGLLAVSVGLAWPSIKQWGAVEGAEVAAATLEHEQLQAKALRMVQEVLTDASTQEQVEKLLKGAVVNLLHDEQFTDYAVDWTARVLSDALLRDALMQYGTEYVGNVLAHDDSVVSVQQLLTEAVTRVVADETIQDNVASGLWSGVRASMIGRRLPRRPSNAAETQESNSAITTATATATATGMTDAEASTMTAATATTTATASRADNLDEASAPQPQSTVQSLPNELESNPTAAASPHESAAAAYARGDR